MRDKEMRTIRGTAQLALLLAMVANNAGCSERRDDIKICVMYPKDVQAAIDACTRLIDHPELVESDRYAWFASRANHKMKAQDFKGAVSDLDEAIRLMPNDPQLFEMRAKAHRLGGDSAAAARDTSRAEKLIGASSPRK
ncbi:MAG TPA: hypothetical protein VGE64_10270 [Xanthomonadaceae bacterium]